MKPVRRWRLAPLVTFLAILSTAGPLGYFGRDVAIFLPAVMFYLPLIAAICLILLVLAIFADPGDARRTALASLAVIVLSTPAIFLGFAREHDQIAFLFWSQSHRALLNSWTAKRGLIVNWDSWGFANINTDAFLISAPSDAVGDAEAIAATSIPCLEPDCFIDEGERMAPGLFIVSVNYQ